MSQPEALEVLKEKGEATIEEVADELGLSQSSASRNLRKLAEKRNTPVKKKFPQWEKPDEPRVIYVYEG